MGGDNLISDSAYRSLLSGQSKSTCGGCAPFQFSKPYVLFSATVVAFATINFFKKNVDNGVVDSPST